MSGKTRIIEKTFEIAAPVETVWKAVTDAQNLENWFPEKAEKTENGGVKLYWDGKCYFDLQLVQFELHKSFTLEEVPKVSEGHSEILNEKVQSEVEKQKKPLTIKVNLESKKGGTILRLVHSGFGNEPHWNDWYEGTNQGWTIELKGLKHYLENHWGSKRNIIWVKKQHAHSVKESWDKMTGLFKEDVNQFKEDAPYALHEQSGDSFEGSVQVNNSPRAFSGTLANMNNSVLHFWHEKMGDSTISNFWISGYGISQKQLNKIKKRWQDIFETIFA